VKLADFGIAKALGRALTAEPLATEVGQVVGTLDCMSPEQLDWRGQDVDTRADVYALGVLLYEMLCGVVPYRDDNAVLLGMVRDKEPVPVRTLRPEVPADLDLICLKCLEKDPSRRYASAAEPAEDLERWGRGEPIEARSVGGLGRAWRWGRRNPALAAAAALIAGVLILADTHWGFVALCGVVFVLPFASLPFSVGFKPTFLDLALAALFFVWFFKLVIGQQRVAKGAVVALLLLAPAVLTYGIDSYVSRRQTAMLSARAVPYEPRPARGFDRLMTAYCAVIALLMLAVLGMAVFASFASFWPYNLKPCWRHYAMGLVDAEVGEAFVNSLLMAAGTAGAGTLLVFVGAYLLEKTHGANALRGLARLLAMLPMAVPGLVLGLGYIFFFNAPANPLGGLYHTLTLLTLCTIVHFYTTGHLTAVTALKSLDGEFEAVSASLKVPFYRTFWRVTLPICTPALIDIARYFFINAMTTISAVVFLYSPETKVAAIAILNLDEAGEMGAAAAMADGILAASSVAMGLFTALGWWVNRRTQAWRTR